MTVKVLAMAAVAATMLGFTAGCGGSATCKEQEVMTMKSADFYTDGKLDMTKAKAAYFAMMEKLGAPVYDVYRPDDGFLWTVDFGQGDFAKFGMGGVFWVNNQEKGYFAHEIFLLPGQSIAEHKHLATQDEAGRDVKPKHESWQVRYGSVYAFCEVGPGEGNLDQHPEIKAMIAECQAPALECIYVEKWEADGKLHELPTHHFKADGTPDLEKGEIYPWHFMMGGPEGAVVSEYATFHHNNGLRFTCPNASL